MKLFGENLEERFKESLKRKQKDEREEDIRFNSLRDHIDEIKRTEWEFLLRRSYLGKTLRESDSSKKLFRFGEGNLLTLGWAYCISPKEASILYLNHIEGDLREELEEAAQDMISPGDEFLNSAIRMTEDHVIIYNDIENFRWNDLLRKYDISSMTFSPDVLKLDGKGLNWGWNRISYLYDVCPQIIPALFGRPYRLLPTKMKRGGSESVLYLPTDGHVWPLTIAYNGRVEVKTMVEKAAFRYVCIDNDIPF